MKAFALILALAVPFAGCARKAQRVQPVSFVKVEQKHEEARQSIASATERNKTAADAINSGRGHIGRAQHGVKYQDEAIASVKPKLELLMQNVPPDLRPEVEAVKADVKTLEDRTAEVRQAIDDASKSVETANTAQSAVAGELAKTNDAILAAEMELAKSKAATTAITATANANADLADTAQKSADKRGNYLGIALGLALAAGATHLMKVAPPYSFALPAVAFPIGYFLARILT